MARTTRDGEVYLTGAPLDGDDVLEGRVEKLEDGRWRSTCELDERHTFIESTRGAAVAELDDHFVKAHTTLNV